MRKTIFLTTLIFCAILLNGCVLSDKINLIIFAENMNSLNEEYAMTSDKIISVHEEGKIKHYHIIKNRPEGQDFMISVYSDEASSNLISCSISAASITGLTAVEEMRDIAINSAMAFSNFKDESLSEAIISSGFFTEESFKTQGINEIKGEKYILRLTVMGSGVSFTIAKS